MNKTENIWLHLSDRLKSFINSKVPDKSEAEDILQEVFVKIHLKIDTLKDDAKLIPWLYQIARNLIADHYRSINKKHYPVTIFEEDDEDTSGRILMEGAVQDMIDMMDNLPAANCEALCMTELEGLSQKEYAERIGITYTAAKSRIQRSRRLLKDMLMKCCHYQFDKYGTVLRISPKSCCCCSPQKPTRDKTRSGI